MNLQFSQNKSSKSNFFLFAKWYILTGENLENTEKHRTALSSILVIFWCTLFLLFLFVYLLEPSLLFIWIIFVTSKKSPCLYTSMPTILNWIGWGIFFKWKLKQITSLLKTHCYLHIALWEKANFLNHLLSATWSAQAQLSFSLFNSSYWSLILVFTDVR